MKSAPFNYHAPTTVEGVVALLGEHAGRAMPLAGGQTLMPLLASRTVRARELIDLNRVPELSQVTRTGSGWRIRRCTCARERCRRGLGVGGGSNQ